MSKLLKYTGKTFQILCTAILALLLGCNLYLLAASYFGGQTAPSVFGYSTAILTSGSMEPALCVNDLILIHRQSTYEEGDIITFADGESLVTHRIIEKDRNSYRTQGDANNSADSTPVSRESIKGKVILRVPGAGKLIYALRTPAGMTALIFIGLLLIELPYFSQKHHCQTDREESEHEKENLKL